MVFKGDKCKNTRITFRVDGTLIASSDYPVLGRDSNWLSFVRVTGISIVGGTLDAKGTSLWACKLAGGSTDCPNGATEVTSLNSQVFQIVINGCQDVEIEGVAVNAAGNSPNTDGIHVQLSRSVAIFNTSIKTGDDCVSIGPGTKDLWIEQISCGPGHGIRIKSWARPSKGFVQRIQFLDAVMLNVKNPILIDQNYCPGVRVSDVLYRNIEGTSATAVAIKFDCSPSNPCSGLRLESDFDLPEQNGSITLYQCKCEHFWHCSSRCLFVIFEKQIN
ncbi:polygalacturonase-like [Pyrus ussuriensis x Pyrus communis]|uniref:Polygalacturonase-like n=1 Tax=Pyrus ussuriensis x Pyrus communis TaxID=2448454 RepID=A0A5N5FWW1_9ROSA|nr:polygalacturonase-like [Pyrus ussuriensis x Pyrus communis]